MDQGLTVLVLNPDRDFFRERLEDGFESFLPLQIGVLQIERARQAQYEEALSQIRNFYPGPVVSTKPQAQKAPWDPDGLRVDQESVCFFQNTDHLGRLKYSDQWQLIEEFGLALSEDERRVQDVRGISASLWMPGLSPSYAARQEKEGVDYAGLTLQDCYSIPVSSFQWGLRDFILERLGNESVITQVQDFSWKNQTLLFRADSDIQYQVSFEALEVFLSDRTAHWCEQLLKESSERRKRGHGKNLLKEFSESQVVHLYETWLLELEGNLVEALRERVGIFEECRVSWEHSSDRLLRLDRVVPSTGVPFSGDSLRFIDRLTRRFLGTEGSVVRGFSSSLRRGLDFRKFPSPVSWDLELGPLRMSIGYQGSVARILHYLERTAL
jgi:hypothetical protein